MNIHHHLINFLFNSRNIRMNKLEIFSLLVNVPSLFVDLIKLTLEIVPSMRIEYINNITMILLSYYDNILLLNNIMILLTR